jgi:hypothetical protein
MRTEFVHPTRQMQGWNGRRLASRQGSGSLFRASPAPAGFACKTGTIEFANPTRDELGVVDALWTNLGEL